MIELVSVVTKILMIIIHKQTDDFHNNNYYYYSVCYYIKRNDFINIMTATEFKMVPTTTAVAVECADEKLTVDT